MYPGVQIVHSLAFSGTSQLEMPEAHCPGAVVASQYFPIVQEEQNVAEVHPRQSVGQDVHEVPLKKYLELHLEQPVALPVAQFAGRA